MLLASLHLGFWNTLSSSVGFRSEVHSVWVQFLTTSRAFVTYLHLFLFPFPANLNLDHDMALSHSLGEPAVLLSMVVHGLVIGLGVLALLHQRRLILFGILWLYGSLIPYWILPEQDILVEYKLYLAMPGLILILIEVLQMGIQHLSRVVSLRFSWVLSCYIGLLLVGTILRNQVFASEVRIWEDTVAKSPYKARDHHNLAVAYHHEHRFQEAITEFHQTIELSPEHWIARKNLGASYEERGDFNKALHWYEKTLELKEDSEVYLGMGRIYEIQKRFPEALDAYQRSLEIHPQELILFQKISRIYTELNQLEESARYLNLYHQMNE